MGTTDDKIAFYDVIPIAGGGFDLATCYCPSYTGPELHGIVPPTSEAIRVAAAHCGDGAPLAGQVLPVVALLPFPALRLVETAPA